MTPDELRARCHEVVNRVYLSEQTKAEAMIESLCLEMIAEGLERAARSCDREAGYDDERSFHARSFGEWCRMEAQRVKNGEGPRKG